MSFVEIFNEYNNSFSSKFSFVFLKEVGHPTFHRKKTRVAAQGLSVSFHIGLHGGAYVRTVGRSHDVISKPKFLALMGLPKSLSYGAPRERAFGACGAPLLLLGKRRLLFVS